MGHFTVLISLSLSEIAKHTHRPQIVNYHGYLRPQIFIIIILKQKDVMQTNR